MLERIATKLSLRARVFLFFAALGFGCLAIIGVALWVAYGRLDEAGAASAFGLAGLIAGFGIVGLIAWVWLMFDENVARAIDKLAGALRARAHAGVDRVLHPSHARYLGDLAPAARAVAGSLSETKNALAEAVERETTRLAVENARLQTLLADVPAGVLLCAPDHHIVFYNGPAADLLTAEHAPGLGRALSEYLHPGSLQAAYERLTHRPAGYAATDLLCATAQTGEVLAGRMRLVDLPQNQGGAPGYVLTLRDVTADLALHARREALLEEVFERVRRPAANLQTVLAAGAARDAAGRATLLTEVESLAAAITELGTRYDAARGLWWPMAEAPAEDLAQAVAAQMAQAGAVLSASAAPVTLRCDAFQLVALLAALGERLVGEHEAHDLALAVDEDEEGALLTLTWRGPVLPVGTLEDWLGRPLEVGLADVTGRSVLAAHGTEAWPEPVLAADTGTDLGADRGAAPRARLCLPIAVAARPVPGSAGRAQAGTGATAGPDPRRAVYDFDLMDQEPSRALAETRLRRLTCVVFDTETTGLLPSQGDEIVQIAALRMLGGRPVLGEAFESLVNPGRRIPAGATEVHGISDAMVAEAPGVPTVLRRFHTFAADAVLVAHNAPFDLEFLRRREGELGKRFDHPVLDTVLLSAIAFGQGQTHTLDALTERLGIVIPPEARHTAMGDTIATAAALEKLIPLLEAKGLETFGDVIVEARRHARLLRDVNSEETVPA